MKIVDIKYTRKKLKNGLDLTLAPMPKSPTFTILIVFKVGSRHEEGKYSGISHFVEHMVFKGNKTYQTPLQIAAAVDKLGGSYNAFTGKEYTGFYVKVGAEFANDASRWLGALVSEPYFKKEDANLERNVILEEINMYNDTPASQVEDIFENLLFKNGSLGKNIIGEKKTLERIDSAQLKNYFNSHYRNDNAILVVAGNISSLSTHNLKNISQLSFLNNFKLGKAKPFPEKIKKEKFSTTPGRVKVFHKKTDQTHLVLGSKTFSYHDKRRYQLGLIGTIMGSGMSSWAFSEIREKRGLAYYVKSSVQLYDDMGSFTIKAGLNNSKLDLAIKEIVKLYKRICDKPISVYDLKKAKDQVIGGMLLERETSDDIAFLLGSSLVSRGEIIPLSQEIKRIKSLTARDLQKVAQAFFSPKNLHLAFIGPWKSKDSGKFEKFLS